MSRMAVILFVQESFNIKCHRIKFSIAILFSYIVIVFSSMGIHKYVPLNVVLFVVSNV